MSACAWLALGVWALVVLGAIAIVRGGTGKAPPSERRRNRW